jgi:hypothetical protein
MEILIGIMPLTVFIMVYIIISIQEWITDMRFYHRRTQKELNRIRRSVGKAECAKTTVPTGTIGYEQLKEMEATLNEAERLIKEAHDKTII